MSTMYLKNNKTQPGERSETLETVTTLNLDSSNIRGLTGSSFTYTAPANQSISNRRLDRYKSP